MSEKLTQNRDVVVYKPGDGDVEPGFECDINRHRGRRCSHSLRRDIADVKIREMLSILSVLNA